MRIFISWSGDLSQRVALILREWIPNVIQTVDLYVSSEDIDKGTRWASEISKELEGASLGIICLTRSNLAAPWILFEAGALSKSIERARVVPLLIDISPSDVEGPLIQFQASSIAQEDIRKMVEDINAGMGDQSIDPKRIEKSFLKWWPDLDCSFQEARSRASGSAPVVSIRSERELIEETLDLTRQISKATGDFDARTFSVHAAPLMENFHKITSALASNFDMSIASLRKDMVGLVAEMKNMTEIKEAMEYMLKEAATIEERLARKNDEVSIAKQQHLKMMAMLTESRENMDKMNRENQLLQSDLEESRQKLIASQEELKRTKRENYGIAAGRIGSGRPEEP